MNELLENGGAKSEKPGSVRNIIVWLVAIAAVGYAGFVIFQSIYFNYQAGQKIKDLNQRLVQIKEKKLSLEALIAYYQTDTFRELEARKKLGLKMPGEKVVKVEIEKKPEQPKASSQPLGEKEIPNWQKWLEFLQGKDFNP